MSINTSKYSQLTFSGHETFVLRSNWLKKAYDLLQETPDLFSQADAFVRLGVGKNMAQSIRFWGRVCHVFEPTTDGGFQATALGHLLFNDASGRDPFLVTPTSGWLLHWQIAARSNAVFTWYYTFNLLRRSEFSPDQLMQQIVQSVMQRGGKPPSPATLSRDIDCMLRCYQRPQIGQLGAGAEDALHGPLHNLDLIEQLPGQTSYHLTVGTRPTLVDQLVAYAALHQARRMRRPTVTLNELAYGESSPGRIFRLDEDALLSRLSRFDAITREQASYSETGGIRQIAWRDINDETLEETLLEDAFAQELRYA